MKRTLTLLLALLLLCPASLAEDAAEAPPASGSAREYANWLEAALPGAGFSDAETPDFCMKYLGADYDLLARTDARYGTYVAAARKASAPALPEDASSSEDTEFSPRGARRIWTLTGGGETLYRFILGENVELYAFDGGAHMIATLRDSAVRPFEKPAVAIWEAADAASRKKLRYMREKGFEPQAGGYDGAGWVQARAQLAVELHSIETWRAGITDEPTTFYLDAEALPPLTAENSAPRQRGGRDLFALATPIGLHYLPEGKGAQSLELMLGPGGAKGVRDVENQCIWEAGPGFDEALRMVEAILGYRPGDADFSDRASVRATLEWGGSEPSYLDGKRGSRSIDDAAALRKLDALLDAADLGQGGYNCPSPCFLTLEYADGSKASLAVAINSFDYFFYRGLGIQTGEGILGLFGLDSGDIV